MTRAENHRSADKQLYWACVSKLSHCGMENVRRLWGVRGPSARVRGRTQLGPL